MYFIKNCFWGGPLVVWKQTWLLPMRTHIQSLALLSGSRIRCCPWAVASVVDAVRIPSRGCGGRPSSDSTPHLGTSICWECSPKMQKKKNTPKTVLNMHLWMINLLKPWMPETISIKHSHLNDSLAPCKILGGKLFSFNAFFGLFFAALATYVKVPMAGTESEPQLRPTSLLHLHHSCRILNPLTRLEIKPESQQQPEPPQRQCWILNTLCQSGNFSFLLILFTFRKMFHIF